MKNLQKYQILKSSFPLIFNTAYRISLSSLTEQQTSNTVLPVAGNFAIFPQEILKIYLCCQEEKIVKALLFTLVDNASSLS